MIQKNTVMFFVSEHGNPGYWVGRERLPHTTYYKFGLMDRKTGKNYQQNFWSGNYKKGAKDYIKKLDELKIIDTTS